MLQWGFDSSSFIFALCCLPLRLCAFASEYLLFAADLAQDVLGDVDRHLGGDRQGDGVAGPAIDLDQLAAVADPQLGEVGVVAQFADEDVLQLAQVRGRGRRPYRG